MRILVLNGPNLNLLGTREPDIYGEETLDDLDKLVVDWGQSMGVEVETLQSNHEGVLIDAIQRSDLNGIVANPGALTHTSRAIADAILSVETPVVEVHISNIKEREPWRANSLISEVCSATIYGRGTVGYRDGLRHLVNRAAQPFETIAYGQHPDQVGDLRPGSADLVILLHGGFFRSQWTRDTIESLAVDLTGRGYTTWNIEYRRLGVEGEWPAMAEDVVQALNHVSQLETDFERVTVIGHSAGGYLSIWASPRSSTKVDQIVALAPIVDLERHARSQMDGASECQTLIDGGAPVRVEPRQIPTLLVHGEADQNVPVGQSADLARAHGLELLTTPRGHFDLLDPTRPHWERVVGSITRKDH